MNKETRVDVACPKCGATDHIWFYYAEWRVGPVLGASTKTGGINTDDDDIANDGPVNRALPRMAMTAPRAFLSHEPVDDLDHACHVWLHERSDYITDESKLCRELQDRLMLSEAGAEKVVADHYKAGDTLENVIERCISRQNSEQWAMKIAADVRSHIPIDEDRALRLAKEFLNSPECHDKSDGADVIRWAMQRELA